MKTMKPQRHDTRSRTQHRRVAKELTPTRPKRIILRRGGKATSVVDATFAALSIRKHAKIKQLLAQTRYGD